MLSVDKVLQLPRSQLSLLLCAGGTGQGQWQAWSRH